MTGWTYTVRSDGDQTLLDAAPRTGTHSRDECDAPFWQEFVIAVYGAHGELLYASAAQSCGDDERDPQRFADHSAALWPGREVCVWSDNTVVPARRRSETPTPDAVARTS